MSQFSIFNSHISYQRITRLQAGFFKICFTKMHYTGWADFKEFASRAAERGAEGGGDCPRTKTYKRPWKIMQHFKSCLGPTCSHELGEKVDPRECLTKDSSLPFHIKISTREKVAPVKVNFAPRLASDMNF